MNADPLGRTCIGALALAVALAACARQPEAGGTSGGTGAASGPAAAAESDSVRVAQLEREARALANASGCSTAAQCRTAPVGDRPCGGPRDYVVFCARTTDTVALNRKLAELVAAEREWNRKTGAMSTCEFRMPPDTALVNGSCRARPAAP